MDQTPATTPAAAAETPAGAPLQSPAETPLEDPGFRGRGSLRRRVRFLRKARELAYRDLGGLVYNLHRFGQRHDVLVIAKLTTLTHIDTELRALEAALGERHPITVLREAGVSACPRCAAIHSGDDRFCPNCGLAMSRRVELPVAGAPVATAPAPASYPEQAQPGGGLPSQPQPSPAAETPPPAAPSAPGPAPAPAAGALGAQAPPSGPAPTPSEAPAAGVEPPPAPSTPVQAPSPPSMPGEAPSVQVPASSPPATPAPSAQPSEQPTEVIRPGTSEG